ncbi:hypothetical protein G7Y31_00515 [Corynebacterium lizhenjunii]|uniref:Or membrane protein n=1 Tax=Corynebacterium lizhenjunii TaxID=2709394 RepID=A0A7T0KF89_9CORY|nr:hypothetical protein [Corynebacterium lizhenjunii]QPK79256.1 hypothetical protein G7Y31_00515 [Corynebacterium lizhenjunii]
MKRFAAGAVAVATALSLSTGVASAADSSNESSLPALEGLTYAVVAAKNGQSEPHKGSTEQSSKAGSTAESHFETYKSSYANDVKNSYPAGTTADILWGTGIAAAILGLIGFVANSGLIPGLKLPF